MHQLVLLTALTATTGLFGGARQRVQYMPAQPYYAATGGYSTCAGGSCNQMVAAPAAPAVQQAAVPQAPVQQAAAPAAQPAQTVQRIQYTYPQQQYTYPQQRYTYPTAGYYYTYAPAGGCPGGNCYRR